ncbi:MarR family winged helix-turn-helix transcriptional regulator [Cellulomonas soli]
MTDDAEPRWLTPDEQRAWIALAGTVIWLPAALDAQLQRDAGLSHPEYQVLSWLSMSTERTRRMSELADTANVTLSHLSRIVARLEQRGWVRRTPTPPTAATRWRSSPTRAGTRSSPPRPVTSRPCASTCSRSSPPTRSRSSNASGPGSWGTCAPSAPRATRRMSQGVASVEACS